MLALPATMAKLGDHGVGIGKKPGAKPVIHPGLRHKAGADLRADLMRIEVDDGI